MNDRTHNEPGDCVKCGDVSLLYWQRRATRFDAPSHLGARCRRCGFEWRVISKDEATMRRGSHE